MNSNAEVQKIIDSFGYRSDASPDPAQVVPVLLARGDGIDGVEEAVSRLSRSVGLYSIVAGGFAPLGVLTSRHGVHGTEPPPANNLLGACSTFQSMMQILQIQMQIAQINRQSDSVFDMLHSQRRDGDDFPEVAGLELPSHETEWSNLCNSGLLPHPDSLTGLPERLQLVGLVLRNFIVSPRDLAVLDDGELLYTFPAGVPFGCPVIAQGVYGYRWTVGSGQLGDRARERLEEVGFEIERSGDRTVACIDSSQAYRLTGVVGPSNSLCPTLRWPMPK